MITPAAKAILTRAFKTHTNQRALSATSTKRRDQKLAKHMAQTHASTGIDDVLAQCSAAHRDALEETSSAAVAASQDTARRIERSQRLAIARCLRRLGRSVDTATEAVELVAVAPTSYGATTVASASMAPKPGRWRGAKDMPAVVAD